MSHPNLLGNTIGNLVADSLTKRDSEAAVAAKSGDLEVPKALKGVLTSKDLEDARKAYYIAAGRVGEKEAEALFLRTLESRAALRVSGAEVASTDGSGRLPTKGEETLIR